MKYTLSTCLCLGWNKGYKTIFGREVSILGTGGPPLRHRVRVNKLASEEDWAFYGDRIWNSVFDMWRSSIIKGREKDRVVWRLETANDEAIKECYRGIGSPQNVFQVYAPRVGNTNKEGNDINRIEKMAKITFNQQYALSRVVIDQ